VRLFLSIPLDEKTRREIIAIRNKLRNHAESGRFTQEENLHLTLVFLGEISKDQIPTIISIMDSAKWITFPLLLNRMRYFKRENGDIYWLGCEKCPMLLKLQKELADKLRVAGFKVEFRNYVPHLTLGRQVTSKKSLEQEFPPIVYNVKYFSLMQSDRTNRKLNYTEIHRTTV